MRIMSKWYWCMLLSIIVFSMTTSCSKDDKDDNDDNIYRYWEAQNSYVQCDVPGITFQLNKVRRTESNELEVEYTLTNTGYDHNVSATLYRSGSGDSVHDDTGRTYHSKSYYDGEYVTTIDGTAFGIYGEGWPCTFYPGRPVLGTVRVKDFSQTATSVWITILIDSNDLGISNRKLEFVNVPIEQPGTSVNYQRRK